VKSNPAVEGAAGPRFLALNPVNSFQQILLFKWLLQESHSAFFHYFGVRSVNYMGGHKYHWNGKTGGGQMDM